MNQHEQISEDLVLFALGELSPEQRAEIVSHLRDCAACRRELEDLRASLGLVGLSATASAPPQRSRQRLMEALSAEQRVQQRPEAAKARSSWLLVPVLAALILAVLLGLKWRESDALKRELHDAQQRVQQQEQQLASAREVQEILTAGDAVRVSLTAAGAKREPQVKVTYVPNRGRVLLIASDLAPLPADKVYELWLLPSSGGAPIPAGTFKPDAKGSAMALSSVSNVGAKGFAVTAEPEGGSATPTMPILLVGTSS